ncbi:MAG: STAS domain-containing protein [Gammaproteobacteria bacterium]|nr:STAS domain-containing protein [Gammaproteobacteria bacterium]
MQASIERRDGGVAISGPLTFASVAELYGSGTGELPAGDIEIDLRGVTQVDSAGLALLVEWQKRARRNGATISLRQAPSQLLELIRVCGLRAVFAAGER